jgi:flagellar biosynthesis chaperone FliJ
MTENYTKQDIKEFKERLNELIQQREEYRQEHKDMNISETTRTTWYDINRNIEIYRDTLIKLGEL